MRLTRTPGDLADRIGRRLDLRLRRDAPAPIAVGYSGGGDSLALLLAADAWARDLGRELVVLNVDHGLQPQSAIWAQTCGEIAACLDRRFVALKWTGPKPRHGLPAAARTARHSLLAEAARAAGANVILLGHTADDVAEAQAMREAGSTTPAPREWAPSPVWPQGRDTFLLRPMLGLARTEIRGWLAAQGHAWIDDPANEDQRYARPRARRVLAGGAATATFAETSGSPDTLNLAADVRAAPWGGLTLDRRRLLEASAEAARAVVAAACLCVAGTSRPPRSDRLDRLADQMRGTADAVATLAGARIQADTASVAFMRETGDLARSGVGAEALSPDRPVVWDGRFEITAAHPGLVVRPLAGMAAGLDPAQRSALMRIPAPARGGLPVILGDESGPACPLLRLPTGVTIRVLAHDRFAAATGLIAREP